MGSFVGTVKSLEW